MDRLSIVRIHVGTELSLRSKAKCGIMRHGTQLMNKITVLLPADEFERFAAYCEAFGHKKSTLIVRLIKEHLDKEHFADQKRLFVTDVSQGRKDGEGNK